MTKDDFDARLREHLQRKPFAPFVVDLLDGRRIIIKKRQVAFCDGAASFIDPDDGALVEFYHNEVQHFGLSRKGRTHE
jgi:hypothetical protein